MIQKYIAKIEKIEKIVSKSVSKFLNLNFKIQNPVFHFTIYYTKLKKYLFKRTYREIVFLKEFSEHPNIIKLYDVIKADNDRDIYLVFEHMGIL